MGLGPPCPFGFFIAIIPSAGFGDVFKEYGRGMKRSGKEQCRQSRREGAESHRKKGICVIPFLLKKPGRVVKIINRGRRRINPGETDFFGTYILD